MKKLKTSEGLWVKDEVGKLEVATNYFKGLFAASDTIDANKALLGILPCINNDMNEAFMKEFKKE